jgi:hypothetical protein
MPRYPSFYLWGALAGCALFAAHAPPPFPLLAVVIMVSGFAGLALSLTYLYYFERRALRLKQAGLRRVARRLCGQRARPRVPPRHPVDAPALVEWDAASAATPVGVAPGGWSVTH